MRLFAICNNYRVLCFRFNSVSIQLLEILSIVTGDETLLYWVRAQMIKRQRKNLLTFKTADMENGAEI